jgi:hypothetical protein
MRITRSYLFRMRLSVARTLSFGAMSALVLTVLAATSYFIAPHHTASAVTPPDSCFAFNAGTGTITNYFDNEGNNIANPVCPKDVDIPSTIAGTPVTAIGNAGYPGAFTNKGLTSVTIPNNVTSLGAYAFSQNQLTTVTIPNSVTSIEYSAFESNQLTTITIEGNPTSLGNGILGNNPITSITYNGITYTESPTIPEACFNYSLGAIIEYKIYDLDLIKSSGIACMKHDISIPSTIGGLPVTSIGPVAFWAKGLTSVVIPSSVTSIGNLAFMNNRISTINIPNGVTSIGTSVFYGNQLTSINIPNGVTSIGDFAFYGNKLVSVEIPSSVLSIDNMAFAFQNTWGGDAEYEIPGVPYLFSNNPSEVQELYDNIWYAQLYTADPSNPAGLEDAILSEAWYQGSDANNNGTQNDSLGGHIINPALITINSIAQDGSSIQLPRTVTGAKTAGGELNNYNVVAAGAIAPIDPESPTGPEQTTMNTGFAQYYRIGEEVTITPPAIPGYNTPPTQTFVLGAATNEFSYVYEAQSSSGGSGGELAETGINEGLVLASSVFLLAAGMYPLIRRFA